MYIRLKDYGKNQKKRKEYIKQSGLLLAGVDVNKAKHDACVGALEGVKASGFRNPIMSTYKLMNVPQPVPQPNFLPTDFGLREFNVQGEKERVRRYHKYMHHAGSIDRSDTRYRHLIGNILIKNPSYSFFPVQQYFS